jgi:hypothetical protein
VWVWGTGWLLVGFLLLFYALRRHDAVGYTSAIGWKIVWGLTTFASWAFGGVDRGWVASIIWLTFAGVVGVISGWPEPVRMGAPTGPLGQATGDLVAMPEEEN